MSDPFDEWVMKWGAHPDDLVGVVEPARAAWEAATLAERKRCAPALDFVRELADEDCEYGDNCPPFKGMRHGDCLRCRAARAIEREATPEGS